jgi:hypothetical protein
LARDPQESLDMRLKSHLSIAIAIAALAFVALAAACGDEGDEPAPATPAVEPTEVVVVDETPEEPICAAGTSVPFHEVGAEAPFTVYCPTFLPDGYELEEIAYGLDVAGAAPDGGVGAMEAVFSNAESGGRIRFVQGLPGLSALTSGVRGGEVLGNVPYDDLEATMSRSAPEAPGAPFLAVLTSDANITHWIEAAGPTEDEVRQIAAGMRPVEGPP